MAKVTSKLQVTVPKAVADRFGIRPGDDIEWRVDGRTIQVVPGGAPARRTLDERLASFDESTRRQEARNRAWRKTHGDSAPPANRGWTREELHTRGRAR
jgi:AbrB family looped-hinge helix DNA binding protein